MAVEFKEFSYAYPGSVCNALNNFNFEIESGQVCAIMGNNGSGKSTIASAIIGLIPKKGDVWKGEVVVNGKSLKNNEVYNPDFSLGLVHDNPRALVIGRPTILEEVAIGLEHQGKTRDSMINEIYKASALFGFENLLNRNFKNISGGQEQRIIFACSWIMGPKLWILDEPTTYLDSVMIERLYELIRDLKNSDTTVIIFENRNVDYIAELADNIILIKEGHILAQGSPSNILTSNILEECGIEYPIYTRIVNRSIKEGLCPNPGNIPFTYNQAVSFFRNRLDLN